MSGMKLYWVPSAMYERVKKLEVQAETSKKIPVLKKQNSLPTKKEEKVEFVIS